MSTCTYPTCVNDPNCFTCLNNKIKNLEQKLNKSSFQFDWKLLKDIILGIIATINSVLNKIPNPTIVRILTVLVSLLQFLLSLIPS